jgi:hypothetical protein
MTKREVAFRNFANAPKIPNICSFFALFEIAGRASHGMILTNSALSFFSMFLTGASKTPVLGKTCFMN